MKFAAGTRDPKTDRPYFMRSECGNYTVTIPLGDDSSYGAWRVPYKVCDKWVPAESLGLFDSAAFAKKACETHQCSNS